MGTFDTSQHVMKTEGPPKAEWDKYRNIIEKLYIAEAKSLREVQRLMQVQYNFNANPRMYRTRLRTWKVFKNLKSSQKTLVVLQLVEDQRKPSISSKPHFNDKDQRRLRRHIKVMTRTKKQCPNQEGEHGECRNIDSGVSGDLLRLDETSGSAMDAAALIVTSALGQKPDLESRSEYRLASICMSIDPDPRSRNTELIYKSIWEFSRFDEGCTTFTSLDSPFWDNLGHGLYFFKVGSTDRAWPVIKKANETVESEIKSGNALFILGLLTTLSPVNTALCLDLRAILLLNISELASLFFGRNHPLAVLARELNKQDIEDWVSETALSCALGTFTKSLGSMHDLTSTAQLQHIAFLRRSQKHDQALRVAQTTISMATALHGPEALQTRQAARQLEHIYMDIGSWAEALAVCFDIVGQVDAFGLPTDGTLQDKCAASTMEDIAKIYENIGDLEKSATWLKKAGASTFSLCGFRPQMAHIVDKLEVLLQGRGRVDEARMWRRLAPAVEEL